MNFVENFSWNDQIIGFELPLQSYLWVIAEATPTDFHEEIFVEGPKSTKFAKVFSLKNNPLYSTLAVENSLLA